MRVRALVLLTAMVASTLVPGFARATAADSVLEARLLPSEYYYGDSRATVVRTVHEGAVRTVVTVETPGPYGQPGCTDTFDVDTHEFIDGGSLLHLRTISAACGAIQLTWMVRPGLPTAVMQSGAGVPASGVSPSATASAVAQQRSYATVYGSIDGRSADQFGLVLRELSAEASV